MRRLGTDREGGTLLSLLLCWIIPGSWSRLNDSTPSPGQMTFLEGDNLTLSNIARYINHLEERIEHLETRKEPSLLTMDTENLYYKVPITHGVQMKNGSVKDACTRVGMDPLCYESIGNSLNVDGCITTAKGTRSMWDIAELLCGYRNPYICVAMFGLFISMEDWNGGSECGVLQGTHCADGKTHTSGPGWVYTPDTKTGEYYGICAMKKWEEDRVNMEEPSLLTTDTANRYYKVPITHGVQMKDGSVKDACTRAGMHHVCYNFAGHSFNVDGCINTAKGRQSMNDISELLCGGSNPPWCSPMIGLFVSVKDWNGGSECGVLEGRHCVVGKYYTSGPGWDYNPRNTKIAQYYGICATKI